MLSMKSVGKEGGEYSHSKCKYETQHIQLQLGLKRQAWSQDQRKFPLQTSYNTSYGGADSNIDHKGNASFLHPNDTQLPQM